MHRWRASLPLRWLRRAEQQKRTDCGDSLFLVIGIKNKSCPKQHLAVLARADQPGLFRVEADRLYTFHAAHRMSSEHFERQDYGLLESVGLALEVEDVDGGIVAC